MKLFNFMTTKKQIPVPNRSISLSEVTQQSANEIIRFIYDINNEDKNLDPDQRSPIKIIINSDGGDVYSGFGIVEAIQNSQTPVYTICHGQAQSMALLVLSAGHKRFTGAYSTVMYHEISWEVDYQPRKHHKQELAEGNRTQEIYDTLLMEFTNITHDQLNIHKDTSSYWYISAEDALRYHIVDEILENSLAI
jgi:ATP-dependent Clp protease protease subunit